MLILTFENFETRMLDYYSFKNGVLERLPREREPRVIHLLNRHPCADPDQEHGVVVRSHPLGRSFKILVNQKAPDGCRGRVIFGYGDRLSLGSTVLAVRKLLEVSGLTVPNTRLECLANEISKTCCGFFALGAALLIIGAMIIVAACQK